MTTDNPSLEPVEVMLRERAKAQPLLVALQRAIAVVDPAMAAMFDTGEPDPRMGKLLDALDIEYAALTRPEAQSLPTVSGKLVAGWHVGNLIDDLRETAEGCDHCNEASLAELCTAAADVIAALSAQPAGDATDAEGVGQ